jgi:hypothetical protein
MVMSLTVFGITIQLIVDGYAVECLRHNHSTWMVMSLTVFGITIQLTVDGYAVDGYADGYARRAVGSIPTRGPCASFFAVVPGS